ncbi:hypothetical protein CICLE_v10013308mg, partial [Citrus x clementina]
MERESLFCVLRHDDESIELNWTKRVNIVKSVWLMLCRTCITTAL